MKSSDVDTQEASKPPKVNENPDMRKVLGRLFHGPPRREEIQNLRVKAELNKPHLTSARCGAAPSFEPRETLGLNRTEGSTLREVRTPGTDGPAGTSRGRCDAQIHQKDAKRQLKAFVLFPAETGPEVRLVQFCPWKEPVEALYQRSKRKLLIMRI